MEFGNMYLHNVVESFFVAILSQFRFNFCN
jgi:hypothetical protein